jgi:hypothetical protein
VLARVGVALVEARLAVEEALALAVDDLGLVRAAYPVAYSTVGQNVGLEHLALVSGKEDGWYGYERKGRKRGR